MTHPLDIGPKPRRTHSPRKSARLGLSAEVILRGTGRDNYLVKIFDISIHGCKAEFVERPQLDELVRVKFDKLDSLDARVCWIREFQVGLEFVRPIHPAVFEILVTRFNS